MYADSCCADHAVRPKAGDGASLLPKQICITAWFIDAATGQTATLDEAGVEILLATENLLEDTAGLLNPP